MTHGKLNFGKMELQKNREITIMVQDEVCLFLYPN